jgi:hypothetical protein
VVWDWVHVVRRSSHNDRRWVSCSRWNGNWQGKLKYSEKTGLNATLATTNPTWPDMGSNPGRRCGKPATNRLSYGMASLLLLLLLFLMCTLPQFSLSIRFLSTLSIRPSCVSVSGLLQPGAVWPRAHHNRKSVADPIPRNEVANWLPGQLEVKGTRRGQAAANGWTAGESLPAGFL